jgi:hypothetical protein
MMSGSGIESALRGPTLLNASVKSFRGGSAFVAVWLGLFARPAEVGLCAAVTRTFALLRTSCCRALAMSSTMLLYALRSSGMCLMASP